MISIYTSMCPNCGGDMDSTRLEKGLLCEKCLPNENAEIDKAVPGKLREIRG